MVKRIEALADAIGKANDIGNPESDAYQLRNPGLCRAYTFKHLGETDKFGRRIFTSLIGGYRFLVQDLEWKCSGNTRAKGAIGKLKPTSTLAELLKSLRLGQNSHYDTVYFLQCALHDFKIDAETPLSYFLEETSNGNQS